MINTSTLTLSKPYTESNHTKGQNSNLSSFRLDCSNCSFREHVSNSFYHREGSQFTVLEFDHSALNHSV